MAQKRNNDRRVKTHTHSILVDNGNTVAWQQKSDQINASLTCFIGVFVYVPMRLLACALFTCK